MPGRRRMRRNVSAALPVSCTIELQSDLSLRTSLLRRADDIATHTRQGFCPQFGGRCLPIERRSVSFFTRNNIILN